MLQLQRWKTCLQLLFLDVVVLDSENNRDMDFSRVCEPCTDPLERVLWQTQRVEWVGYTVWSQGDRHQQVRSSNSRRGTELGYCSSVILWCRSNGEHCWPGKCLVLNSVVSQTAFKVGCVPFNTDTGVWFERLQWRTYDMHFRKRHGNKSSSTIVSLILTSCMWCRHRALHFYGKAS